MEINDENKQKEIHEKGFDLYTNKNNEYAKIKFGPKVYDDVTLDFSYFTKLRRNNFHRKDLVIEALINNDIPTLREISRFFYRTNGIYQKIINYYATMYRFDWYMVPEIFSENPNETKIATDFVKVLDYFDNSNIKKNCNEFTLKVIRDGVFYGYAYEGEKGILIQELPWKWCRSRFDINGFPAIEFNMHFFDSTFPDIGYRMKMLDLFPKEFKEGYLLYKQNKLPNDRLDDIKTNKGGSWYLLDPGCAFKFSIFGMGELPLFINAIPEIIDLGVAQGVDR